MLHFNSTSKLLKNTGTAKKIPLYTVVLLFKAAGQQTWPEGCFFKDKSDISTLKICGEAKYGKGHAKRKYN